MSSVRMRVSPRETLSEVEVGVYALDGIVVWQCRRAARVRSHVAHVPAQRPGRCPVGSFERENTDVVLVAAEAV